MAHFVMNCSILPVEHGEDARGAHETRWSEPGQNHHQPRTDGKVMTRLCSYQIPKLPLKGMILDIS